MRPLRSISIISTDTQPCIPRAALLPESWSVAGRRPRTGRIQQAIVPGYHQSVNSASICNRSALQMPSYCRELAPAKSIGMCPISSRLKRLAHFLWPATSCSRMRRCGLGIWSSRYSSDSSIVVAPEPVRQEHYALKMLICKPDKSISCGPKVAEVAEFRCRAMFWNCFADMTRGCHKYILGESIFSRARDQRATNVAR